MGKLFGTDGVRGVANTELTGRLAYELGRAGAYVLTKEHITHQEYLWEWTQEFPAICLNQLLQPESAQWEHMQSLRE